MSADEIRCTPPAAHGMPLPVTDAAPRFPPQIRYIIGNEAAERFSFYGMRNILTVFLVDYLLSREGQDLVYASGYEDSHLVPGSKTAAQMEQLQATGVKFIQADVAFYQRNDEREQTRLLNNFVRILSQK